MQSAFYSASNSLHFPLPWNHPEIYSRTQNPLRQNHSKHCFSLTNSLRTSIRLESDKSRNQRPSPSTPCRLPVVIQRSGRLSGYFWDGYCLRLVGVDGDASAFSSNFDDGFRTLYRNYSLAVRDFFIPKKVSEHYLDYVKWKFLHRVFSSALQVIATQAMFRAIGIGYSHSLASAAALNWVLKEGLGRLSRCIYTASLASAFDTNLKRVRFSTSVWFSLSIAVELLTPVLPQYFLLLATVANIAKQISLACYLATSSAVHRSFAVADNIGEVSAKAQIQSVCFDNLGLMLAALLNMSFKHSPRLQAGLPFVAYPIFTAIDLFGIYQGLKHVHLQTLTKDRLEIIINMWIELGNVPSPAEVSKEDGIDLFGRKGKVSWPIRIGLLNTESQIPKLSMASMLSIKNEDYHFISMEIFRGGLTRAGPGILLCVREGGSTENVIMGLLQACYLRKAILSNKSFWEDIMKDGDISDSVINEWLKLMEDSKQWAKEHAYWFYEQMSMLGWAVKNVLLSAHEQCRYSFLDH